MIGEAWAIAQAVREGRVSAVETAQTAINRIRTLDGRINAVTRLLEKRALAEAALVDQKVAAGFDPGPLAGVPYGVKDLFDVAGLPTTAGAGIRRDAPPASVDAQAIMRLNAAGAVLVATLNMDEFAYGFATVNATWGTTRNPHDPGRLAGGSSGGSAAGVAAGMLPFTLGSDTNGSIRIPASLCGVWGLKPTHGALPMEGVFPFVDSFDDIGPFTRSARDLALITGILAAKPLQMDASPGLCVARLGGWFANNLEPAMETAFADFCGQLGALPTIELPQVDRARSAAFLMTAAEGGRRHLPMLRHNPAGFDPATRDRLIAGAALPSAAYLDAQDFRIYYKAQLDRIFETVHIAVAPVTVGVAPRIDNPVIRIDGRPVPARANLGLFTQPLNFAGLPVISAPLATADGLPLGVQLIGPPGSDATLFAFAADLEQRGLLRAHICENPACP
ncbi:AtzE family amidohydrolase [Sphingobium sp.]|uniref:AtzE family amidohydrolase n=1 Tax=Sphingobium sp. TaxID=1912891 RepID=UPI0026118B12|nr:AtzE family amidohydrolase [Sphingobium sp.]